jgi:uncharacterized protein YqgV (UPF0045/DUF77 family)
LKQLESKKLKYVAGLAKNRKVIYQLKSNETKVETRLDELAKRIQAQAFTAIQLDLYQFNMKLHRIKLPE